VLIHKLSIIANDTHLHAIAQQFQHPLPDIRKYIALIKDSSYGQIDLLLNELIAVFRQIMAEADSRSEMPQWLLGDIPQLYTWIDEIDSDEEPIKFVLFHPANPSAVLGVMRPGELSRAYSDSRFPNEDGMYVFKKTIDLMLVFKVKQCIDAIVRADSENLSTYTTLFCNAIQKSEDALRNNLLSLIEKFPMNSARKIGITVGNNQVNLEYLLIDLANTIKRYEVALIAFNKIERLKDKVEERPEEAY
jgi:hypothetical protein